MPFYIPTTTQYAGMTIKRLCAVRYALCMKYNEAPSEDLKSDIISITTIINVRRDFRREQDIRLRDQKKKMQEWSDSLMTITVGEVV
jgi:hypothetical protein